MHVYMLLQRYAWLTAGTYNEYDKKPDEIKCFDCDYDGKHGGHRDVTIQEIPQNASGPRGFPAMRSREVRWPDVDQWDDVSVWKVLHQKGF